MDDTNLEKLSVSPGKLTPKFNQDVTEYAVVVGSNVKELKVNPLTSDSNASYSISGSGGGKTVPLKEGEVTMITIEVTSEDGTTKKYTINVKRLSSSDASLSNITLSSGILSPVFNSSHTQYSMTVPYHVSSLEAKPFVTDKATSMVIRDNPEAKPVVLNYGETTISIDVTSPDKTTSKTYKLLALRMKIPWPLCLVDTKIMYNYSCPVCLGIFHCPKSITETKPKHVFCKCCVEELTRTTKRDPLNGRPLTGESWLVCEETLEQELGGLIVCCIYSRYGCQEQPKLMELGSHMEQCDYRLCFIEKSEELSASKELEEKMKNLCISCPDCNRSVRPADKITHKAHMCSAKHTEGATIPQVPVRAWEKKLQQETSEKSVEVIVQKAEEQEKLYFQSLRLYGQSRHCDSTSSPANHLKLTSELYATAIKLSPKDAKLHFKLAQILEELHFVEDCFGFKAEEEQETSAIDFNQQSRDSSKEDDIQAICEQRGVGRHAPLASQLKAIDEEYHYLLDNQQSDRCEYVQKLYAWKAQQATQDGKVAQEASSEEGPFGKAFVKYADAVSFGSDNHLYHLHVGRFLLFQDKPEEAVKRLQIALGLKPVNVEVRFYLGLALLQLPTGPGDRQEEAIEYVHEALELILYKLTKAAAECPASELESERLPDNLYSSELLKSTNVQCLKGFNLLGEALARRSSSSSLPPSRYLRPADVFRSVSGLAVQALCSVVNKGILYRQIEWTLLLAHSNFLQLLLDAQKNGGVSHGVVARHCDNLSALVNVSSLPKNNALLQLQEKTCQQGVVLQPHSSRALYLLGNAQLSRYDNEPNNDDSAKTLEEAQQSFRTSLELEGKASSGHGDVPGCIQGQRWWKQLQYQNKPKAVHTCTSKAPPASNATKQRVSPTKGTTTGASGRGRGTTAVKNITPARVTSRQPASKTTAGSGTKTGPITKTATTKTSRNTQPKQTASTTKTIGKTPCRTCSHTKVAETPKKVPLEASSLLPAATNIAGSTSSCPVGPPNVPSYHARLGLARVLARSGQEHAECLKLYEEVTNMAPEVHDAYIELGDILVKSDPLAAVGVYSKYPFPDPLSYDDAYLHGEIVSVLMKNERFDDPRLATSMIALGRVMGLSVLEKYVEKLDSKLKYSKVLMKIYAEVNGKNVDDPELKEFFKFKCWL